MLDNKKANVIQNTLRNTHTHTHTMSKKTLCIRVNEKGIQRDDKIAVTKKTFNNNG
jgi:hypothetical protein